MASCAGRLLCYERRTGQPLWSYDTILDSPHGQFHGAMLVRDDLVVVGTDDVEGGRIYAFEAATGNVRWTFEAGPSGVSSDILGDGELLWASTMDGRLLCLEPEGGSLVWSYEDWDAMDERPFGPGGLSPALEGPDLFWATLSRELLCFEPKTGEVRWRCRLTTSATTTPHVTGDRVLVGTEDGQLVQVDRATGEVVQRFALDGMPYGFFVPNGESILVFTDWMRAGSELVALTKAADGIRWSQAPPDTTSWTSPRPFVFDGYVYAGNQRGDLIALEAENGSPHPVGNFGRMVRAFGEADGLFYLGTIGGALVALQRPEE